MTSSEIKAEQNIRFICQVDKISYQLIGIEKRHLFDVNMDLFANTLAAAAPPLFRENGLAVTYCLLKKFHWLKDLNLI